MARLIQAAINGRRTRVEHPGVPTTPEQHARGGEVLRESGLAQHCLRVLLEPPDQDADAALGVVTQLEAMLHGAGITIPRLLHGVGRTAWRIIDEAATRGYHTRVGFEDIL